MLGLKHIQCQCMQVRAPKSFADIFHVISENAYHLYFSATSVNVTILSKFPK